MIDRDRRQRPDRDDRFFHQGHPAAAVGRAELDHRAGGAVALGQGGVNTGDGDTHSIEAGAVEREVELVLLEAAATAVESG